MRTRNATHALRSAFRVFLIVCCAFGVVFAAWPARAQSAAAEHGVSALMVSDIHFEPFWDPGKAAKLAAAPTSGWKSILGAPDSPDRAQKFAALEQTCKTRGEDTTFPLYESSLKAIVARASDAKFVTVSGDLISHSFTCKFGAVFPQAAPGDYQAFVMKTIDFVVRSLREALSGVPVYAALGNNDSGCGDYQLDANSDFLTSVGKIVTAELPQSERAQAEKDFAAGGYYSVTLPAPMEHARLLVLDDLFMSRRYQTCAGKDDPAPAAAQIAWLAQQLSQARRQGLQVWVMAHIPPGVDAYATATKGKNICEGKDPTMFLSSEALPDAMIPYGDVIRLAIFAHTHMDELRLLQPEAERQTKNTVVIKMVSSISPIDGNDPSFTVARVEPETATLKDYRVFVASNQSGTGATWAEEYDYARAYHEPEFSAAAVRELIGKFAADPSGQSAASQNFIRSYSPGASVGALQLFWPQYVCALKNDAGAAFAACACGATP
jgi:sphingomyelin phosphodiesterase acid-like 3